MKFLLILLLFVFSCDSDDNPITPTIDCAGVSGGSAVINECNLCVGGTSDVVDLCDADEDGYDDRDIQVLQDFIDLNESLTAQIPLDIGEQEWDGNRRLTYLNLSNNQLTSIPASIGDLNNLIVLELPYNQLTSLPESIGELSALHGLVLYVNQITSLPESICELSNLGVLNLQDNQLTNLPECIGDLSELVYLWLHINQLTYLPESIGNLTNLQQLYLQFNLLTNLPESICNVMSAAVNDNLLCEEYHYDCIGYLWGTQIQDDCCEGPNGEPNWTTCPWSEETTPPGHEGSGPGCTDENACNYNPTAGYDDDSCIYENYEGNCP